MNCHEDNTENKGHSPLKHMLHMVLCCGLPIIILMALPFIARFGPGVAALLGFVAPFICPLMMGGMIVMLIKGNKKSSCCDKEDTNN